MTGTSAVALVTLSLFDFDLDPRPIGQVANLGVKVGQEGEMLLDIHYACRAGA